MKGSFARILGEGRGKPEVKRCKLWGGSVEWWEQRKADGMGLEGGLKCR